MEVAVCAFVLCVVLANIPATRMSCSGGSFPDEDMKCIPCPQHCLFCDSNTKCLSCESGYWGTVCEKPCSMCRTNTSCEKTNGFCLEACRDGYSGVLCEDLCNSNCSSCNRTNKEVCLKCASGRYPAVSCYNFCSTCDNSKCDEKGVCTYGCKSGYAGIKCDEKESNLLVVVIFIIVAVAVLIVITAVVIIIRRKRRPSNLRSGGHETPESKKMIETEPIEMIASGHAEASKKNVGKSNKGWRTSKQKKYTLKRQKKLYELAKYIQTKTDEIFWNEWAKLPTEFTTLCKECQEIPGFLEKQRIGPYEFNKVTVEGKDKLYYFNASYIDVNFLPTKTETLDAFANLPREEKGKKAAYIACIGPTPEPKQCFDVFWRMVWQENCQTILMLNTINTKGNYQYWPNKDKKKTYSRISVVCKTVQQEKDFTVRRFNVTNENASYPNLHSFIFRGQTLESEERTVNHFQYAAWPEGGRVINTEDFLEFCKTVQSVTFSENGPVLVHGRAGIGRTGTFIALDMLWKAAEDMLDSVDKLDDKGIDIQTCVENLRKQRTSMVETVEQYRFLQEAFAQVIMNLLDERGYQKKNG